MRHIRTVRTIGAATVLVVALSAVIASAASAKEVGVLVPTFGPYLEPGASIDLEHGGVSGKTTSGIVNCDATKYPGLTATLLTNWEKTEKIEVKSARGIYFGAGTCESTLPIGGQVKMYWFGGSSLGTLLISALNGKAEYKANPANQTEIEFYSAETEAFCTYGLKKLKGKWESHPFAALEVFFNSSKLKLIGHYLSSCPKKMELSAGYGLRYAETPAEQENEKAEETIEIAYRDSSEKP